MSSSGYQCLLCKKILSGQLDEHFSEHMKYHNVTHNQEFLFATFFLDVKGIEKTIEFMMNGGKERRDGTETSNVENFPNQENSTSDEALVTAVVADDDICIEEVPITEDFPVLNEVETDEDAEDFSKVNVIDCIEDYCSIFEDDSSCKYAIAEDDASDDSEDKEENHLVFIVFCETYVNVLRTGYIGLSVCGYKKEEMCWGSGNNKDRKWRRGEDLEWAPSGSRKKFFAVNSEDRVFKEYYGFAFKEPGGYDADISWIDYDDLNLYSKNVHNNIDYDIETGDWIVIVEI